MYTMAAVGWMILFAAPPIVAAYLAVTSEMREKTLKARQDELIEEWGRNVRLGVMGAEVEDEDDEAGDEDEEDLPRKQRPPLNPLSGKNGTRSIDRV